MRSTLYVAALVLMMAGLALVASGAPRITRRPNAAIPGLLARGPHAGECERCHSMHGDKQPQAREPLLTGPNDNTLCEPCHETPWSGGSYPGLALYSGSAHGADPNAVWPGSSPPARPEPDAAGKCLNCHDPHGWPDPQGVIPRLALAREERLCLQCHDGAPARTDIRSDLNQPYRHPTSEISGRHTPGESGPAGFGLAPENRRHAECEDCHNPHVARGDDPTAAPGQASKRLLGVSRVAVLNGPAGAPTAYTFVPASDSLTSPGGDEQVCFKCHSSWTTQPPGQSDLALKLNPNNPSFHPVEAAGRNANIRADAFAPDWNALSLTACGDCHGSDTPGAAAGPHGSSNAHLLKRPFDEASVGYGTPGPSSPDPNGLCFSCHAYGVYADAQAAAAIQGASRFNRPSTSGGHAMHVGGLGVSCYACHDSHGSTTQPHLIVTGRQPGIVAYSENPTGGSCTPVCHGVSNYAVNYPR